MTDAEAKAFINTLMFNMTEDAEIKGTFVSDYLTSCEKRRDESIDIAYADGVFTLVRTGFGGEQEVHNYRVKLEEIP